MAEATVPWTAPPTPPQRFIFFVRGVADSGETQLLDSLDKHYPGHGGALPYLLLKSDDFAEIAFKQLNDESAFHAAVRDDALTGGERHRHMVYARASSLLETRIRYAQDYRYIIVAGSALEVADGELRTSLRTALRASTVLTEKFVIHTLFIEMSDEASLQQHYRNAIFMTADRAGELERLRTLFEVLDVEFWTPFLYFALHMRHSLSMTFHEYKCLYNELLLTERHTAGEHFVTMTTGEMLDYFIAFQLNGAAA